MIKFVNNNISIVRGDTGILQINFSQEVDSAVFSVKKNIEDTEYVLQKNITDGVLQINHDDTNDLEAGKYVYDIQVTYNGIIDTPIIAYFMVIADVTRE